MAKGDYGYSRSSSSRGSSSRGYGGSRGRPRGQSFDTWLQQTRKDDVKDYLIRDVVKERLEAMGVEPDSEIGLQIREGAREEIKDRKANKEDFAMEWNKKRNGNPLRSNAGKVERHEEAEIILEALQSVTRVREKENLDEGEWLDDPVITLMENTGGWGDEMVGATDYRKHVNICIDNSGSTHTPETGHCSRPMTEVVSSLCDVLSYASDQYPGVTWGVYEFNKTASCKQMHGKEFSSYYNRYSSDSRTHLYINDPLQENATATNLAPLMKAIYDQEEKEDLLDSPRFDIILTDGEFETQQDADEAASSKARRGNGINSYVLNLCPEAPSEIQLPSQFRVLPLNCIYDEEYASKTVKRVDKEALRNALYSIVIDELIK